MPITAIALCAVAAMACSLSWRPWPAYRWRGRSTAGPSHYRTPTGLGSDQQLPNVPAKSLRVVLVEYGPGGGSPSHRHPSSAFIYARVLEGAIRSKVNEAPERTYQAGESWIEKPGDHHQVSHNASDTEPAKLLAIFVVDTSDREIVIRDK